MKNAFKIVVFVLFVWLPNLMVVGHNADSARVDKRIFRIAELNCENLFDTIHDEGFNDYEFLPSGNHEWNTPRYFKKLSMLSREIVSLSQMEPVDLVALIEVENDSVLRDLTRRTKLGRLHYQYVMTHCEDPRGVDVALLYQEAAFWPLETMEINWRERFGVNAHTRDVLHVKGIARSGDTLDVMVCHMPSRLGGRKSQRQRNRIASCLKMYVDSIQSCRNDAKIILLGDFNDTPLSASMTRSLGAIPLGKIATQKAVNIKRKEGATDDSLPLYNLSYNRVGKNGAKGTYRYRGDWNMLDQCVVNGNMLNASIGLSANRESLQIVDHLFLMEDEKTYGGKKPWRTYQGPLYKGGFSDHLPILVELEY